MKTQLKQFNPPLLTQEIIQGELVRYESRLKERGVAEQVFPSNYRFIPGEEAQSFCYVRIKHVRELLNHNRLHKATEELTYLQIMLWGEKLMEYDEFGACVLFERPREDARDSLE